MRFADVHRRCLVAVVAESLPWKNSSHKTRRGSYARETNLMSILAWRESWIKSAGVKSISLESCMIVSHRQRTASLIPLDIESPLCHRLSALDERKAGLQQ